MSDDLRSQLNARVRVALAEAGGDAGKIDRGLIVRDFAQLGVPRSTCFRWITRAIAEQEPTDRFGLPADGQGLTVIGPRIPVFKEQPGEPQPFGLSSVMGGSSMMVVEQLLKCVEAAAQVMAHARHKDGSVRLPKSLLVASEHMRRTLETAARLHENIVAMQRLENYLEAFGKELASESPDIQARILARVRALDARWRNACKQGGD